MKPTPWILLSLGLVFAVVLYLAKDKGLIAFGAFGLGFTFCSILQHYLGDYDDEAV